MIFFGSGFSLRRAITTVFVGLASLLPCFATFTLDPTFGGGGKVLVSFPDSSANYSSAALRVFVQPSGRIVVGGVFSNATPDGQMPGVALVGLAPNGLVDTTFSQVRDWSFTERRNFRDALMYPDGTTLLFSQIFRLPVGSSTVRTLRIAANGEVDGVFASNVSIAPCGGFCTSRPVQISVRSDGKILALIKDDGEFFLYRLNPDGTRDTTFGVNGISPVRFNRISIPFDPVMEMVVLNDGKILIVGHVDPLDFTTGSSKFFLARLTETGIPDKTFAGLGFQRFEFGAGLTGFARRAFLQADGKILLCGNVFGPDSDSWMMRFRPNGKPDTTFGNNGVVIHDLEPGGTDVAEAITFSPDGKIRLVGYLGSPTKFLVARLSSSGSLEESTTITFTPNQYADGTDIALQSDGKLIVVGRTKDPSTATTGSAFAIARLTE